MKEKKKYKMIILVRKDLHMPPGKLIAQACHASVGAVLKSKKEKIISWKQQGMKKVALKVKDEKELLSFQKKAQKAKLTTAIIKDAAKTFFKKPTITTMAIGPDKEEKIDKITGHLKMI